jgi:hypothetical protein
MQIKATVQDSRDVETWVERMIAEHGYAQISLHGPAADGPGVAFTVGLERSRHVPELLCLGVAPDIAGQLFAACIEGHDRGDHDLAAGEQTLHGLIEDYAFRLRRVSPALLTWTNALRPDRSADSTAMLHLLIPDNSGVFPDEAGCDPRVAAAQDPDRLLAQTTN